MTMRSRLLTSVLLLATAALLPAQMTEDASLQFFRDLAETRNFTLGRPVSPKITPDGASVIFLRASPRSPVLRLYEMSIADGTEREVLAPEQLLAGGEEKLSAEEKARRERQRQSLKGFTSFQLSRDGTHLLVSLSGKLYVVKRSDLTFTELPGAGWLDPRFSPDGAMVAGVIDRELHVVDLVTNTLRAVTSGATATLSHGTAEFVAQEEMSRSEGYWWSPDSKSLVYQQTDESQVETRYIANPLHPEEKPTSFAYPKAGSPNAVVRLFVTAVTGGAPREIAWDRDRFPYLARVDWSEAKAPLTILVQNREQTEQVLLAADPATGATRELLREADPAWLNLDDGSPGRAMPVSATVFTPLWLADGSAFLWTSESRGSWQVELRSADGKLLREITPPDFVYRSLIGLDEKSGAVFVHGSTDAREIHVWRFALAGGAGTQLTQGRGYHGAIYSRGTGRLIRATDAFDGRFSIEVVGLDGRSLAKLRATTETPPRLPTTELTRTLSLPNFDAALTRPQNFQPGRKYPVILNVYAGPGVKRVNATIRDFFPDQWMADQGYIVVRIDGRGTPGKGRDWERIIKGNFIDVPLNDQIAGLQALAGQYPELDLSRVGVSGWSFGGYFSAMAAIRRPDIFRAGIVGAPVITWENYDTHYTERYLGTPQANPEAYRVSNVTTYVQEAKRPLFLIHGLTDDNVYFQHALQLADALYLAGKPYDFLPMLGTHMISDPMVRLRQQQRVIEFFNQHVKQAQ